MIKKLVLTVLIVLATLTLAAYKGLIPYRVMHVKPCSYTIDTTQKGENK